MSFDEVKQEIASVLKLKDLDELYKKYLGKKGEITLALKDLGKMSEKEKKEKAPLIQSLKREVEEEISKKSKELKRVEAGEGITGEWVDVTAPGHKKESGHLHPLTIVQDKINEIFGSLGFEIVEGPEIENEWYNFDALNIPKDHPARDLWDTFWLKPENAKMLLRTHTSPVQIRYMESHQPPLRIIAPGRVFRHEASDASHDIQFYQLEGLMVGRDINVGNFKSVINTFLSEMFAGEVKTRLRPSFFPFVEPGFEVDMSCINCDGQGCSVCSQTGWLEMMGAGMVHPNVFKAIGYNPGDWQGFAFGVGIDRIAMMKYKIDDIRLFYAGDLRFLKQF